MIRRLTRIDRIRRRRWRWSRVEQTFALAGGVRDGRSLEGVFCTASPSLAMPKRTERPSRLQRSSSGGSEVPARLRRNSIAHSAPPPPSLTRLPQACHPCLPCIAACVYVTPTHLPRRGSESVDTSSPALTSTPTHNSHSDQKWHCNLLPPSWTQKASAGQPVLFMMTHSHYNRPVYSRMYTRCMHASPFHSALVLIPV